MAAVMARLSRLSTLLLIAAFGCCQLNAEDSQETSQKSKGGFNPATSGIRLPRLRRNTEESEEELERLWKVVKTSNGLDGVKRCELRACGCCPTGSFIFDEVKGAPDPGKFTIDVSQADLKGRCDRYTKERVTVDRAKLRMDNTTMLFGQIWKFSAAGRRTDLVPENDALNRNKCGFSVLPAEVESPLMSQPNKKNNTPAKSGGSGASSVMPSMLGFVLLLLLCARHV